VVLAAPGDGLAFPGAARVAATAVERPSRDLNFMVSDALPARVELLRGAGRSELAGAAVAVFAVAGDVTAAAGDIVRPLGRHGCAWCTDAGLAVELAAGAVAAALVIER
ncbi:MAG TPA: HutD family protein, partial [Kofleriaceae bacterium]|nr:HutD family protein [Kofleriaceae bacterium]